MKRLLTLLFVCFCGVTQAQKVKVKEMNKSYFHHQNVEGFSYLHDETSKEDYQWIANVRIEFDTIKPNTLNHIYNKTNSKANRIGGNAFRVIDSDIYSDGDQKFIEFGIFHLRSENRAENLDRFQDGRIYMFGFLGHHERIGGYKIAVDGEKMILPELSYKLYQPKTAGLLRLRLGAGFKRHDLRVLMEPMMLPRYYKFNLYRGVFSRSQISEHEWSFGEYLARILKKQPLETLS